MKANHVDDSIANILDCHVDSYAPDSDESIMLVHPETLHILYTSDEDIISEIDLKRLARSCEQVLMVQQNAETLSNLKLPLQGLIQLGHSNDSAKVLTATLIGVNFLESSIRSHLNYSTGKAPLLKTMLSQMQVQNQVQMLKQNHMSHCPTLPILNTLLLPQGLNLRNLLWHGFLTDIPPCWLALVIVLIVNLEQGSNNYHTTSSNGPNVPPSPTLPLPPILKSFPCSYCKPTKHMNPTITSNNWIPSSHHKLYYLALDWIQPHPTMAIALLSIILEHTLRLEWCRVNHLGLEHTIAKSGTYYVTLDGHGQRHYHDLLLHPYITTTTNNKTNQLVSRLGPSRIALLTDLFASSCGPFNLRAGLAHGVWDDWFQEELLITSSTTRKDEWDNVIMLVQWCLADNIENENEFDYQPQFSYTAVTKQLIQSVLRAWQQWVNRKDDDGDNDDDHHHDAFSIPSSTKGDIRTRSN